ncbi:MAG: methionyl-tRNA formyltransferase, partial [Elusimicrobiota bacterium]
MRLLFFGSPEAAVPFLEECGRPPHRVLSVVTRPDRPSGRGLSPKPPAVKDAALRLGLGVLQPEDPSSVAGVLKALGADMAVVVAYGKLLKPEVLGASRLGSLNVHFSLLPRCRGAAPVAWTLLRGEKLSGVSLFWLDEGMDTGPLQRAAPEEVGPEDDALTLMGRLVSRGVLELRAALSDIESGRVRRDPQRGEPTLAPKLKAADARLDLGRSAEQSHACVRALRAGPRAFLELKVPGKDGKSRVTVLRTA